MANRKDFIDLTPHTTDIPTTQFDLSHNNHLSMKIGVAYPCLVYDAPAHSTIRCQPSFGFDFMPFRSPVQSTVRAHLKLYKIPKRILCSKFSEFMTKGNNIVLPYIKRSEYWHGTGSLADYMGIPSTVITSNQRYVPAVSGFSHHGDNGRRMLGDVCTVIPHSNSIYLSSGINDNYGSGRLYPISEPLSVSAEHFHYFSMYTNKSVSWSSKTLTFRFFEIPAIEGYYRGDDILNYLGIPFRVVDMSYGSTISNSVFVIPSDKRNIQQTIRGNSVYTNEVYFSFSEEVVADVNKHLERGIGVCCLISWPQSAEAAFGSAATTVIPFENGAAALDTMGSMQILNITGSDELQKFVVEHSVANYGIGSEVYWYSDVTTLADSTTSPFMSIEGADPAIPISAMPFRAYQFIRNYFYRNKDINPFTKDGVVPFDEFLPTTDPGADTETPLDFFNVQYETDLFTSCLKSPTYGMDSPLVPLRGRDDDNNPIAVIHMKGANDYEYDINISYSSVDGTITGATTDASHTEEDAFKHLQDALNFGISVHDFQNYSALTKFQERVARVQHGQGSQWKNFNREFFGTNPNIGDDFPEYLGGVSETLNVSKLMNTGEQENLGEFCGVGSIRANGEEIKCFTNEDCYIMGIIYLTVAPVYAQQLPRLYTKTSRFEFANPQFNSITPQPVYKHQLAPLQMTGDYGAVFGWNVPFAEYRQMLDEVHGNFRTQSMHDYLMQRLFPTPPSLNEDFITIENEDVVDVFKSTIDDDKVFGIIHFDMKGCKLPFPQYMDSKIL